MLHSWLLFCVSLNVEGHHIMKMTRFSLGLCALICATSLAFSQARKSVPKIAKHLIAVNPVCAANWSNQPSSRISMGSIPGPSAVLYVFGSNKDGVAIEKSGTLIACDQINNSGRPADSGKPDNSGI